MYGTMTAFGLPDRFDEASGSTQFIVILALCIVPIDVVMVVFRKVTSGAWDPSQPHLGQRYQFLLHALGWSVPVISAISLIDPALEFVFLIGLAPVAAAIYLVTSHNGGREAWLASQDDGSDADT